METKRIFHFEIIINALVSFSDSFEYPCYGSMAVSNILILSVREPTIDSESDVYGRLVIIEDASLLVMRMQWRIQNVQEEGA